MIPTRPSLVGKILGAGALALTAALVFTIVLSWVVKDYAGGAATIERLETRERELLIRRRDVAELEDLRTALEAADPEDFGVIHAATLDVALADMQQTLRAVASDIGAAIQDMRSTATDAPDAAALAVRMTLPSDQLAPLLIRLGNARTAIFLESFAVSSRPARPDQPVRLDISMVTLSYVTVSADTEADR